MSVNIFNYIKSELKGKTLEVITVRKNFLGTLVAYDDYGNLSLQTENGRVFIQRKFIVSVQVI